MNMFAADDCRAAQKFLRMLDADPMGRAMGAPFGEIIEGWLRKHIRTCEKCRKATMEGNMP